MSADTQIPKSSHFFRYVFACAALLAGLGVALDALNAHLPDRFFVVPGGRVMLHTAVETEMWHALALMALSLSRTQLNTRWNRWACMMMLAGVVLFCLPVTLVALTGLKIGPISIGRLAPYGGTLLMMSWLMAAFAAVRGQTSG